MRRVYDLFSGMPHQKKTTWLLLTIVGVLALIAAARRSGWLSTLRQQGSEFESLARRSPGPPVKRRGRGR
jgi:hypothetical protein